MSKVLLICNGEKPGPWLKKWAKEADFIIAADAGADKSLAVGVIPNLVIGDLDSLSARAKRQLKEIAFIHVKRQDNTDLEKALDWIVAQHFDECMIVGATGERLDFTLGNMLSIYPYLKHLRICLRGKNWTVFPLIQSITCHARKGARMSLLPLKPCKDITLKGLQYSLNHADWQLGQTGISNVVKNNRIEINFKSGYLLMYLED